MTRSITAIRAENLGKSYFVSGPEQSYKTLREAIANAATAPLHRARSLFRGQSYGASDLKEEIWALKDVSFEIKHGEAVGIIGHNGAGKSTLLKILSRITEPTSGYVDIYGRIGALLEVGTGFHPELTGRENIYLNGAILGMSRRDIEHKFDEIVDFSGVGKFIDTPVKHYSSGMGLRLGFAVAAHLEPEILVVDEVLAVGDAEFQKKCLGKMSSITGEGRTVLLVSHNMVAVQSLCQTSMLLQNGRVIQVGVTKDVIRDYLNLAAHLSLQKTWENKAEAPGNDNIRIHKISVSPKTQEFTSKSITMITPLNLTFEYWNLTADLRLSLSVNLYDSQGVLVFNSVPVYEETWFGMPHPIGLFRTTCEIPGNLLNSGLYRVELLMVESQARIIYRLSDAITFEVADSTETRGRATWYGKWEGVIHPNINWETSYIGAQQDEVQNG